MQVTLITLAKYLDLVGDRRFTDTGLLALETQDLSFHNLMPERDVIQAYGDEFLLR